MRLERLWLGASWTAFLMSFYVVHDLVGYERQVDSQEPE